MSIKLFHVGVQEILSTPSCRACLHFRSTGESSFLHTAARCSYKTSQSLYKGKVNVSDADRENRIMHKLMGNDLRRRQRKSRSKDPFFVNTPTIHSYRMTVKIEPRRANVLNTMFKTHISDILSTGECSQQLVGKGVEITMVKVNLDLSALKIYWANKGKETNETIAEILGLVEKPLRHELTHLHLLNFIPQIVFKRDKDADQIDEVGRLLERADMGEMEEGVVELSTSFSPTVKAALEEDRVAEIPFTDAYIRQDMGGIDRDQFIKKIFLAKKLEMSISTKPAKFSIPSDIPMVINPTTTEYSRRLHIRHFIKSQKKAYRKSTARDKTGGSLMQKPSGVFVEDEEDFSDEDEDFTEEDEVYNK